MEQFEIKRWNSLARSWRITNGTHDFLSIGPTPHNEKCTPAGQNQDDSIIECQVYASLLQRVHGAAPEGTELVVLQSIHGDGGMYHEVGIIYELDEGIYDRYGSQPPAAELERANKAMDYAMKLETGCDNWDDTALEELREAGHSMYTAKIIKMKAA